MFINHTANPLLWAPTPQTIRGFLWVPKRLPAHSVHDQKTAAPLLALRAVALRWLAWQARGASQGAVVRERQLRQGARAFLILGDERGQR